MYFYGGNTYTWPTTKTVTRKVTTTTEYDEQGRVVKVTTVEETTDHYPNTYTPNVWYSGGGAIQG